MEAAAAVKITEYWRKGEILPFFICLAMNQTIIKKESCPATTVYVTLRLPPLDSEMGWTGELWSKTKFLILEN